MINKIKYTLVICLAVCLGIFTSCSDDDKDLSPSLGENQGEVIFSFARINTYHVDDLLDIKTIKVTLKKDGKEITLPSYEMFGTKDSVATKAIAVDAGSYALYKYIAFDNRGDMLYEAYPEDEEYFEVRSGELFQFYFPIKIRVDISTSLLKNKLLGMCQEIWGNDTIKWPKTWREYNNEPRTWENLYWELDGYNNAAYISGIRFDETFKGMTKLPQSLFGMVYMTNIDIINLPEFTDLGENIADLNINSLYLENTGVKEFPKEFGKMRNIYSLTVVNCPITKIPESIGEISTMNSLHIENADITEVPYDLVEKLDKYRMFNLKNTKITSLPDNFFTALKIVSTVDLSGNKGLSVLPSQINQGQNNLRGLNLSDCSFTSIPEITKVAKITHLTMNNNELTSFASEDMSPYFEVLNLNGNNISTFPSLTNDVLVELTLSGNPITVLPDLSGYPQLAVFGLASTGIELIPDSYFASNPYLSYLDLSNNANLTNVSENAGFTMETYDDIVDGVTETKERPQYLSKLEVNDCPELKWVIPASWLPRQVNGPNNGLFLNNQNSSGVIVR